MAKKKPKAKILSRLAIFLGITFIALVIFILTIFIIIKHLKIKEMVENEIKNSIDIRVTIDKIDFSPLLAHIALTGVTIYNPKGFTEEELAYFDSIHIVFDPLEIIIRKKPDIYLFAADLKRLNVIKNREGKVNIKEMESIKATIQQEDENPFYFDVLVLNIGDINYIDYTGGHKKVQKFHIGIKNAAFVGIKNEDDVVKMIIYKAIENTNIGKMINLTIVPVVSDIKSTMSSAWGTAKIGAKSLWHIFTLPVTVITGNPGD